MEPFDQFAQALALTESENTETAWGDGGPTLTDGQKRVALAIASAADLMPLDSPARQVLLDHYYQMPRGVHFLACGRWQIHPAWYHDWAPKQIGVLDSWDTAFRKALALFFLHRMDYHGDVHRAALEFHLGVEAFEKGKLDQAYLDKFAKHYAALEVEKA